MEFDKNKLGWISQQTAFDPYPTTTYSQPSFREVLVSFWEASPRLISEIAPLDGWVQFVCLEQAELEQVVFSHRTRNCVSDCCKKENRNQP